LSKCFFSQLIKATSILGDCNVSGACKAFSLARIAVQPPIAIAQDRDVGGCELLHPDSAKQLEVIELI
jgi:hypothetical protein